MRRRQKKLDKRKIHCEEINWTIQLPIDFKLLNQEKARKEDDASEPIFSCSHDKLNHFSAAISKVGGFSADERYYSREDRKQRLFKLFSRLPGVSIEPTSSAVTVGGKSFEQFSLLVFRKGKPIFCFEYLFQLIGEYELSISVTYNNETQRLKMFHCLAESVFG